MDERTEEAAPTAFDSLVERMRRDVEALETTDGRASEGIAKLKAILDAALHEAGAAKASAAQAVEGGAKKAHDEMKAHPMTTISAAFAAGYMIGKSIAGRMKP
jgi:ElaB/YqjD/DUF883 family membrane-anchored ribosome-binding protein